MNDIMRQFIRVERLGDWKLHLETLNEMLPLFAASGHHMYAKTVWLYLQDMEKLEAEHPSVYCMFLDGNHVVRNNVTIFWNWMESDKAIECFLMKQVKGDGGLTRMLFDEAS